MNLEEGDQCQSGNILVHKACLNKNLFALVSIELLFIVGILL